MTDVDVIIVGAGLSGIGAAATLTREHPGRSYLVLEKESGTGGTWNLFRYPGVRSDSDMYTLGYGFKPWLDERSLADGAAILDYVRETATEYRVDERIRTSHHVTRVAHDSASATWTVHADTPTGEQVLTCSFLWVCSGYYDTGNGYTPHFEGLEEFEASGGTVIHPQHWPEGFDHTGQRVVVVGSGATAVTLVPSLADTGAAHVTMLQRSPTYVISLGAVDPVATRIRRHLSPERAYRVIRRKNVAQQSALYRFSRRFPRAARALIRKGNVALLPEGYDVDTHFRPRYDPWDQRLCLVPDADLFRAISRGAVEVVTDTIDRFTAQGVLLTSGRELRADTVVTATGLNLQVFGGAAVSVDGEPVTLADTMAYRALMLSGVPNLVFTVGYTNASWTLKADLVAEFACRLLRHMDEHGYRSVVPVRDPSVPEAPFMDFEAGYVRRAADDLPRAGEREPWKLRQNYRHDVRAIRGARFDDGALRFGR